MDLLHVVSGTTPGWRRTEAAVGGALRELGLSVAEARSDFRLTNRIRHRIERSMLLIDLFESAALRRATGRALRRWRPRAILYGTAHAAMLQPGRRTRGAAISFDCPATFNRRGPLFALEHWRERRAFGRAALLLPLGLESADEVAAAFPAAGPLVSLPVPLARQDETAQADERGEPMAVAYAANPQKKGLDILARAWSAARPAGWTLVVAGIGREDALRYLGGLGIPEPPGVEWAGLMGAEEFRSLTRRARVYLAASQFEDYGLAQLEALADGAPLVTLPSPGRYEALKLARRLDRGLVAEDMSAEALAAALRAAMDLTPQERATYGRRARELTAGHSAKELRTRLARDVVPVLMDGRAPT